MKDSKKEMGRYMKKTKRLEGDKLEMTQKEKDNWFDKLMGWENKCEKNY